MNQFPRRLQKEQLSQELEAKLEQQKLQKLSLQEYKALRKSTLEQGECAVPLFLCDQKVWKLVNSRKAINRLYSLLSLAFLSVSTLTSIPAQKGIEAVVYGVTLFAMGSNSAIYLANRRMFRQLVISIEWDMQTEELVFKQPDPGLNLRVLTRRVPLRNLGMLLSEDQADKRCLYFDKATGQKFATVELGDWYNQGLLYFLLARTSTAKAVE
jgi:hypothetical protein